MSLLGRISQLKVCSVHRLLSSFRPPFSISIYTFRPVPISVRLAIHVRRCEEANGSGSDSASNQFPTISVAMVKDDRIISTVLNTEGGRSTRVSPASEFRNLQNAQSVGLEQPCTRPKRLPVSPFAAIFLHSAVFNAMRLKTG